ncbi:acylphosphatase [Methanosarcina hadiensis]|uniref:acylphosphatase n=1 Tax=Methanosarcina hadiensis TaxID=3078083 RepID=UPI0039774E14
MQKRAEIKVYGRVQKAGFRDFIDEIAFNLNLNGYVKNLDDGTVQVVCEGDEAAINELLKKINIVQYPIRVENIEVSYKNPTGEFKIFELIRDEDITTATYERMDAAARYIREMNSNLCQKMDFLGGKIDVLGGKMDSLGEKVDFLGGKIDVLGGKIDSLGGKIDVLGGRVDSFGGKIDVLGNKIDLARVEISSEIRISRDSLRSHLDGRISNIERELALIKSKVVT